MSREAERHADQEHARLQHAAEHETSGGSRVMVYLVILFAAAFCLMLLSYLMQQRNNRETVEGLKQSVSTMTSVQDLMVQNRDLSEKNDALESRIKDLEQDVRSLEQRLREGEALDLRRQSDLEAQDRAIRAMAHFWRINEAYARGRYTQCRELIQAFEAEPFDGPGSLPGEPLPSDPDSPSPAARYQEILSALG